jgi:hypothetical protein
MPHAKQLMPENKYSFSAMPAYCKDILFQSSFDNCVSKRLERCNGNRTVDQKM